MLKGKEIPVNKLNPTPGLLCIDACLLDRFSKNIQPVHLLCLHDLVPLDQHRPDAAERIQNLTVLL